MAVESLQAFIFTFCGSQWPEKRLETYIRELGRLAISASTIPSGIESTWKP
jgi:hypothetical protein